MKIRLGYGISGKHIYHVSKAGEYLAYCELFHLWVGTTLVWFWYVIPA